MIKHVLAEKYIMISTTTCSGVMYHIMQVDQALCSLT